MIQTVAAKDLILGYSSKLQEVLVNSDWSGVNLLAQDMLRCWQEKRLVFFCGNGGSVGNTVYLANDFLYGITKKTGGGLKVQALSANSAVITCLANDVGCESIFSEQLAVQAQAGDLLIALSCSGNSPNIVRVIEQAKAVNDMQIAEDMQLIVGHMMMQ